MFKHIDVKFKISTYLNTINIFKKYVTQFPPQFKFFSTIEKKILVKTHRFFVVAWKSPAQQSSRSSRRKSQRLLFWNKDRSPVKRQLEIRNRWNDRRMKTDGRLVAFKEASKRNSDHGPCRCVNFGTCCTGTSQRLTVR